MRWALSGWLDDRLGEVRAADRQALRAARAQQRPLVELEAELSSASTIRSARASRSARRRLERVAERGVGRVDQ